MEHRFSDNLDVYPGEGGWYFVRLPEELWEEIREFTGPMKRGFGSIKVSATVGQTTWQTSIFPDTKTKRYILFIKKSVRQAEKLELGDEVICSVKLSG